MADISEKPNFIPWPPIILVASILGGIYLNKISPWPLDDMFMSVSAVAGIVLIVGALLFDFWAIWTFRRHKTTVSPIGRAKNLATDGPFALSRNPIYAANVVLICGVGLYVGTNWHFILAILAFFLMYILAVRPEEAHLEANFGQEWRDYAAKTRRWL